MTASPLNPAIEVTNDLSNNYEELDAPISSCSFYYFSYVIFLGGAEFL